MLRQLTKPCFHHGVNTCRHFSNLVRYKLYNWFSLSLLNPFSFSHLTLASLSVVLGGSIEATPPSDSITTISVDLLLSPDGSYSLLSTSDVIHSSPYTVWGGSTPQSSVDQSQLTAVVSRTAHAAQSRGILGYLSVELLTFINPETVRAQLSPPPSPVSSVHCNSYATCSMHVN